MASETPARPLSGWVSGFGNIGRSLTRFLHENMGGQARIIGACDPDPAARAIAEREFGLRAVAELDELLRIEPRPDFIIIASTSSAHAAQIVAAAEAGLHVFCEKPIALSLTDADRAIGAAEVSGVVTQVNYSLRYIEAYRTLHDWIAAGRFGRVMSVSHARTRGYGLYAAGARHPAVIAPELSGGWAVHHACHGLDLLYWLNGPFTSIQGQVATTAANGSEEAVQAVLTFANGAIGHVSDSVCHLRDHFTQVIGTAGSAVLTGEREHTVLRFRAEGSAADELVPVRDVKDHAVAFETFFAGIRRRDAAFAPLRDARPSLAAALGLLESARTGRPVVLA